MIYTNKALETHLEIKLRANCSWTQKTIIVHQDCIHSFLDSVFHVFIVFSCNSNMVQQWNIWPY